VTTLFAWVGFELSFSRAAMVILLGSHVKEVPCINRDSLVVSIAIGRWSYDQDQAALAGSCSPH